MPLDRHFSLEVTNDFARLIIVSDFLLQIIKFDVTKTIVDKNHFDRKDTIESSHQNDQILIHSHLIWTQLCGDFLI